MHTPAQQSVLDRFQKDLDVLAKTIPMTGTYERIEPYIREFDRNGQTFSLIIFHKESQIWFDNNRLDKSLAHFQKHHVIRSGDIIFDLGCNVGFNMCWYAKATGPRGRVYAFDPYPWNATAARYNAEVNGLDNVTVYQVGIGSKTELVNLSLTDSRTSIHEGPYLIPAQIYPLEH